MHHDVRESIWYADSVFGDSEIVLATVQCMADMTFNDISYLVTGSINIGLRYSL